ncbi:phosphate ABC transporter permease PstA [Propionibacterium freudenreichii]|uniref:phosphate ABC transporter permease PstA n=1 Tax=Propionibacterium freudenreichii TaxID=1744 RepID=UPI0021A47B51|nr:phosphate ABC transporter permease PstA [Propionibacterium freudenreichii]MCT2998445.1 phosphate ABC transporter permease PstA [Propionibacterium freudenreichii]MCT3003202.1 phosphate ABC transporter permease PstA [Propionibacterium freudenreichii]
MSTDELIESDPTHDGTGDASARRLGARRASSQRESDAVQFSDSLTAGHLPPFTAIGLLVVCVVGVFLVSQLAHSFSVLSWVVISVVAYLVLHYVVSRSVEGRRRAFDRFARDLVTLAFLLALVPLVSLIWETVSQGAARFDWQFFTKSMYGVIGDDGGAGHAVQGTLIVTAIATLISVPIGLLTAVYLVEYGRGKLASAITLLVDVMTGIPSIVAGLFAYALFVLVVGVANATMGITGAVALCVLMIPYIVRSSEEMLQLVPKSLREASYALGVPKWRTILKVVIPTALSGIVSGVVLGIARVIGETAPLLITAGFVDWKNPDPVNGAMATLPVFVYKQYMTPGVPQAPYYARAWTGALTLILIVMVLNLLGRLIAARFAPHTSRK